MLSGAMPSTWALAFFLDHNNTCLFISPLQRKLCTVFISVCLQDYLIKSCEFFFVKFWKMWALGQQTIDKIRIHHPDPNTGFFLYFSEKDKLFNRFTRVQDQALTHRAVLFLSFVD